MTETLQYSLASGARSGVYRLAGRTSAKAVRSVTEAGGWQFLHLDAGTVDQKGVFLAEVAGVLCFPPWAGHNWDAFEELVNDLSWLPDAPGYVLLLDRVGRFARRQPAELETALDVLESAMVNRRTAGQAPMIVLVRGAGPLAEDLPTMETGLPPKTQPAEIRSLEIRRTIPE